MILETIITSIDANNVVNIAPFGIREEGEFVLISPFKPSASLDNFLNSKTAVLNLTDDVRIFAGALTDRRDWPLRRAEKIKGFVLKNALAHRELELVKINDDEVRPILYFRTVHEASHASFRGFNRAQAAVIELSVLVSRLNRLPMEKIESEMAYLKIAVDKTAGKRELEAWGWLVEHIENYKAAMHRGNLA